VRKGGSGREALVARALKSHEEVAGMREEGKGEGEGEKKREREERGGRRVSGWVWVALAGSPTRRWQERATTGERETDKTLRARE